MELSIRRSDLVMLRNYMCTFIRAVCILINVCWHKDEVLHQNERAGWAALSSTVGLQLEHHTSTHLQKSKLLGHSVADLTLLEPHQQSTTNDSTNNEQACTFLHHSCNSPYISNLHTSFCRRSLLQPCLY